MSARENDAGSNSIRGLIVSKAKYLGSCLLPSPIESEATLSFHNDRIEIPELDTALPIEQVSKVELFEGSNLPAKTAMMFGVVGVVIEKDKPYMIIVIGNNSQDMLFKLSDRIIAEQMVAEINNALEQLTAKGKSI
jgi:hypothetical protein